MFPSFMPVERRILTVTQLGQMIKRRLDSSEELQNIIVRGELSRISSTTIAWYFDIKEGKDVISCVLWRNRANQEILSCLKEGNAVDITGNVTAYTARSTYQLTVTGMKFAGRGTIDEQLEQLRLKLEKEGLFAAEHKKPLPQFPRTIAVVTSAKKMVSDSEGSAAYKDVLKTIHDKWPLAKLLIRDSVVQGASAPASLIEGLHRVVMEGPDVIILCRGGGSPEDLMCFNDEQLARTIYACPIPVITGIGHQIDVSIADLVADFHALTPTAAAQAAVPDRMEILQHVDGLTLDLDDAVLHLLQDRKNALQQLEHRLQMQAPAEQISREKDRLKGLENRLKMAQNNLLQKQKLTLQGLSRRLDLLSPRNVMERGYAVVFRDDNVVTSAADLDSGDRVRIGFADGEKDAIIE